MHAGLGCFDPALVFFSSHAAHDCERCNACVGQFCQSEEAWRSRMDLLNSACRICPVRERWCKNKPAANTQLTNSRVLFCRRHAEEGERRVLLPLHQHFPTLLLVLLLFFQIREPRRNKCALYCNCSRRAWEKRKQTGERSSCHIEPSSPNMRYSG